MFQGLQMNPLTMTKTFLLFLILCKIVTPEDSPKTCKCWEGYELRNGTDGPECAGVLLRNVMPCNAVRVPNCVCGGNIIIDHTKTWCSSVKDGKIKKSECENKAEWDEYFKYLEKILKLKAET